MKALPRSLRPPKTSPRRAAGLTLAALVTATTTLWVAAEHSSRRALATDTQLLAEHLGARVGSCVNTRFAMLEALGHEWRAGGLRDSVSFGARVDALIATFPGFLAVNRLSAEGVIREVHPVSGNQSALGRNIYDNAEASSAIHATKTTGVPRLTAPTQLFQGGTGFAIYLPIGAPPNDGFVNGVFRAAPLIASCLGSDPRPQPLRLTDGSSALYQENVPNDSMAAGALATLPILIRDRRWTLTLWPSDAQVERASVAPRLLLVFGTVLSFALSALVLVLLTARARSRRIERAQLDEIRKLACVVDEANDFVGIGDDQGRVTFLNASARRLTGLTLAEAQKLTAFDLIAPEDRPRAAAVLRDSAQKDGLCLGVVNRVSGAVRPVEFQSVWLPIGNGRQFRATIGRDLTDRRALESDLAQAQKMEALGRMAGGVAHDINNILTVVMSAASMLTDRPPEPEHSELVGEISSACDRAAQLTRQLFAFGRGCPSALRPLDLARVISDMHPLLTRLVRSDVSLNLHLPKTPVLVTGNAVQLGQIVLNLVVNAVDAMPEGGRVSVSLLAVNREVVLSVADTGVGMSPEVASRIFDPFFTTKGPGKGTGLGLATVYGHVQRMRGRISVESAPGKGARFLLTFPELQGALDETAPSSPSSSPRTIGSVLLVEDQDAVRSVVGRMLRREGYRVIEARDGREAIGLLLGHCSRPDVVVSDVVMPGVSGVKLFGWMRDHLPQVPIVLASAHTGEELDALGGEPGAVEFLQKPFDQPALMRAIAQSISRKQAPLGGAAG